MFRLTLLIIINSLIFAIFSYSVAFAINSESPTSINNYFQNFASCSCDITPSLCDNYCCCDLSCIQSSVDSWSKNYQCLTQSQTVQKLCSQIGKQGLNTFDNLACVYYSNRGTIGNYYSSSEISQTDQPTSNLFSSVVVEKPDTKIASRINALSLGTKYTSSNQYIKVSGSNFLFAPLPTLGVDCAPSTVNISASGTYTCRITPTAQNCASINDPYDGTYSICSKGDCSANNLLPTSLNVLPSSVSGTNCINVISSMSINLFVKYSNGQYQLDSTTNIAVNTNPLGVPFNTSYNLQVTITTNTTSVKSGNPGYIIGKAITMPTGINNILTGSNCVTSASVVSSLIKVPFGVQKIIECLSPSPCNNTYYIDTLGNATVTFNKYASQSSETLQMGGTGNNIGSCNKQSYEINILYSYSGWELDPQYYITSAYLITKSSPDLSQPTKKYLSFKWIYVDPSTIITPPTNTFYQYFNNLWTPLKQKFGLN